MRIPLILLSLLFLTGRAQAADDHSNVGVNHAFGDDAVRVDGTVADIISPETALAEGYRILFINRCEGGLTISRGFNDSRANTSSIIDQTRTFPPYPFGDESWELVMEEVRDMLLPFGLIVTDVDPGSEPHTEIIVCGRSFRGPSVLGVAPFGCGIVQNAIGYAFAENHQNSPRSIAETIVHEAGHTYTLNHLYDCADPMTYLNGCGDKYFQDAALSCAGQNQQGQWVVQSCGCGGATQNSYQTLLGSFGPREVAPPGVVIYEPAAGTSVVGGFPVRASVTSEVNLVSATLYINGELINTVNSEPWVFNAPDVLKEGSVMVTVESTDQFGNVGSETVTVFSGEPCQCASGEVCLDKVCVAGPDTEGGLGAGCEKDEDCGTGLCGLSSAGGLCTARCEMDLMEGCPDEFACIESNGGGLCWPSEEEENAVCGCQSTSSAGGLSSLFVLGLAAFGLRRRRSFPRG